MLSSDHIVKLAYDREKMYAKFTFGDGGMMIMNHVTMTVNEDGSLLIRAVEGMSMDVSIRGAVNAV